MSVGPLPEKSILYDLGLTTHSEGAKETELLGAGMATFSLLPLPETLAGSESPFDLGNDPLDMGVYGSGLTRPYLEQIGVSVRDAPGGVVEIALDDYVVNHIGALQGGVLATLCQVSGELAASHASGAPMVAHDMAVQYLSLGRTGPFRTRGRVIRATASEASARVEVVDAGAEDRLLTIATVTALAVG